MQKILFFFLIITSSSCFSYNKTGIDLAVRGGYREDNITLKSTFDMPNYPNITFYNTKLANMKSIQITGLINLKVYGLCVGGTMDYGWILSGDGKVILPIITGIEDFLPESSLDNLKGHVWDYFGRVGYGIELYNSEVIVVPQIGYGCYYQTIKRPNFPD